MGRFRIPVLLLDDLVSVTRSRTRRSWSPLGSGCSMRTTRSIRRRTVRISMLGGRLWTVDWVDSRSLPHASHARSPSRPPGTFFNRREFCFTLDGDVFVRYQSFKNGQELKAAIQKRVPSKIDIGPVYNVDPQKRAAYANQGGGFAPQERELVFDIDLTVCFRSAAYSLCRPLARSHNRRPCLSAGL